MDSNRVLIYPYDSDFAAMITSGKTVLKEIKIAGIISPIGWGLCGKPVVPSDENPNNALIIQSGIEFFDPSCFDILLIVDSDKEIEDKTLISQISFAAKAGKKITVARRLSDSAITAVKEICLKYTVELDLNDTKRFEKNYAYGDRLYDIHTPIISVSGIGENCEKLTVQIELRKKLMRDGYKICSVSSQYELPKDFAVLPFPSFMQNTSINESDKIITYNHYIHQLEQQEEPDAFIIGIPGGIMPITRSKTAFFGVNAFEVYNAVTPDFTIVNLYCGDCSYEYLTEINKIFQYKFHTSIDCFFVSRYLYDSSTLNSSRATRYMKKDTAAVIEQVQAMSNNNYKLFENSTLDEMQEYIIDTLGSYDTLKIL